MRWPRHGLSAGNSETQIVPLVIGDADEAVRASERALEMGVFAQAIRPPTVPADTSRLRLAVMASHTKTELREAAATLAAAVPASVRHRRPAEASRLGSHGRVRRPARRRLIRRLRGLFVTGTDTGVGKSVVSAAVCAALAEGGERGGGLQAGGHRPGRPARGVASRP